MLAAIIEGLKAVDGAWIAVALLVSAAVGLLFQCAWWVPDFRESASDSRFTACPVRRVTEKDTG